MSSDIGLENGTSSKVLTTTVVLLISLLVLSSVVFAGSNVRMWVESDTYNLNERFTIYFDFPSNGSYSLIQVEPRRTTIFRERDANEGTQTLTVADDVPGRHEIKVVFEGRYSSSTDYMSYYISGGEGQDQDEGQDQGGSEENYSLSYFKNREPSQGAKAARDIQNRIRVIRPGDSGYRQLERSFESKASSSDLSREQQNTGSIEFSFGSSGMEFSIDQSKENYYSLNRSLNNQGATFFGSKGGNNYLLMEGQYKDIYAPQPEPEPEPEPEPGCHCMVRLPCSCMGCCSPIFICLPGWLPWPLPSRWLMWVLLMIY